MSKKKICLDAGHYGKYNRSPAVLEYTEAEAMWKLHLKLLERLEDYGFSVSMTRSNQASDMGVTDRGRAAKGCDLFLSLHSNAVGMYVNESVDYPVVYVPLDGTGDKIGAALASCIEKTMGTKQKGRIATRKGSSGADYYGVIRGAVSVGVPGLILEHSFHTNTTATKWLLNDSNLDKMAEAEAACIASYFGQNLAPDGETDKDDETPTDEEKTLYRVQTGAYSIKGNAAEQFASVKAAGFDAIVVMVDGLYKVQVGAYSVKANAEAQAQKLKKAGFSAFITTKGGTAVSLAASDGIKVGSFVKVKEWAKTYSGGSLASFVYKRKCKVDEIKGDRVVISYEGIVIAAVHKDNLILV